MTEESKKYPEVLIWLLTIVVIFQSVFIVKTFDKVSELKPLDKNFSEDQKAEIRFSFEPSKIDLKKGESTRVDLVLTPGKKVNVSGMDIILTFDPGLIQISQSEIYKILPTVIANNENEVKGRIGWTYLNEKVEPVWLNTATNVLSLTVKGKSQGKGKITVLQEEKLASTVVVEDVTARKIPFAAGELEITVR